MSTKLLIIIKTYHKLSAMKDQSVIILTDSVNYKYCIFPEDVCADVRGDLQHHGPGGQEEHHHPPLVQRMGYLCLCV